MIIGIIEDYCHTAVHTQQALLFCNDKRHSLKKHSKPRVAIMFRRSLIAMNKQGRTVVRDPRVKSVPAVVARDDDDEQHLPAEQQPPPLPLQPLGQQQPAGLGSMMLMGGGMAIGFSLVGALFG